MKKILNVTLALIVIAATLLSLTSCSEYKGRTENERTYYLPHDMQERSFPDIPIAYSNNEATFVLIVWGRAELADQWYLDEDFDVFTLTEKFIYYNGYGPEYEYDEERGIVTLNALATEYEGQTELDYFFNFLAVTDGYAYIVTMHCDEDLKDKYAPLFDEWASMFTVAGA